MAQRTLIVCGVAASLVVIVACNDSSSSTTPAGSVATQTTSQLIVAWVAPTPISYGTPLSTAQLNATASMEGSFVYSPAIGTVLTAGQHTLTTTFTADIGGAKMTRSVMLMVSKATSVSNEAVPASSGSASNVATATGPTSLSPPPVLLQLSAGTYTTDENAGWLSIPVIRTGSSSGAITVSYTTANGSATAGGAYGSVNGVTIWEDGDSTPKLITVPILDQQRTAGVQTFTVSLSSPEAGAALSSPASATVTVLDNDLKQTDYCRPNSLSSDSTADFCTTPNFPTYGTAALALPANPNAQVGDGLELAASATNLLSLVMGSAIPGANMTTGQSIRSTFYMNYITGNLNNTLGSPIDTGQSNNLTFAAVARHYEPGDSNDVHLMGLDGLHLRALCSQNHTDCSPGHVFAGMIRLPAEIRPGMTIKVRYKSPAGPHSWAPIWLASGSQYSPGPGGNPYQGFGTTSALARVGSANNFFEIDLNDNYPRWGNNPSVPMGQQLDYGIADIYGVKWNIAPHPIYWANGNGYIYQTASAPAFESLPINWSTGFHDLVLSWESDNQVYEFVDGKLVAASYMEYPASTYVDALAGGATKTLAMNLMIGNQAIPSFTPGGSSAAENDGITDGWTIIVQEISVWNGNIPSPNSYQAAPNGCDLTCQKP